MELVNKQKVEALFSPALTGKTTYTADEILLALQTMPTIEAIPIEWIKDWRKEKWFDRRLSMEERMVRAMVARMILEDWEKENETR